MTVPAETRIAAFIARYSPEIAAQLRESRARLRALFPRGYELVFDNYNALVFGFSPTEKTRDAFVSIAGYPRWVTLFFLHGATLADPANLLEGEGKQVRSIRLKTAGQIDLPNVRRLIERASEPVRAQLDAAPPLTTVVKMELVRQRARRPARG